MLGGEKMGGWPKMGTLVDLNCEANILESHHLGSFWGYCTSKTSGDTAELSFGWVLMFSFLVTKQSVLHSHQSTGNAENDLGSVKHWANLNFCCLWDLRTPGTCFNMTVQWGFLLGRLKFLSAILTNATTGKWVSCVETTCGPYTFLLSGPPFISIHLHSFELAYGLWAALAINNTQRYILNIHSSTFP